ncbi:MAG: hypothetical protein JSU99_05885 [Nitrospiraceae bacterium]|nr:MAG: hypothetical protein JSU99_05885 [Nitrospiraceae bacterium]
MKCLKCISLIAVLSFLLIACGGGGGGGVPALTYTGVGTQAVIDQNNVNELTGGAFKGVSTSGALTAIGVVQKDGNGGLTVLTLSQVLRKAVQNINISSNAGNMAVGVQESGSIPGLCGANATYNITVNDATGDFSGFLSFNVCDMGGIVVTGGVSFSGGFDYAGNPTAFNLSFNYLSMNDGVSSITSSGSMSMSFNGSTVNVAMSMLLRDDTSGYVYKIENLAMNIQDTGTSEVLTISGRFYEPLYGYVVISTPTPFIVIGYNQWPSSGLLMADGANGTWATLEALSDAQHCRVRADTIANALDEAPDFTPPDIAWADI